MVVTQTTDGTALLNALVSSQGQFSGLNATYSAGDASQVGTYTGFTSSPVIMSNGVVLSTGHAADTTAASHDTGNTPSTDLSGGSTSEIDSYAPGHITNWTSSHDAAKLTLNFSLAAASAVSFQFSFGSVEYPEFVDNFTDAFFAFLDGNQVSFDSHGNPVQVGASFASSLTTADTNTAFGDPHGLVGVLTTTSGQLLAGDHTISFEVADTNDGALDSAVFLTNFTTAENTGGPVTTGVPEPASMATIGMGLLGLGWARRRRAKA